MSFDTKSITAVTEADLLSLISSQVAEGKTIDYKRDKVGNGDTDKKEFLYDVSSFANTAGGQLIFGMEEAEGLPIGLPGIAGIDPEQETIRMEQLTRDGIRPPISGLQTGTVRLTNGNVALVVRVPKSWNPPHQVTYQKAFRFYARDTNNKYQIDVDELRSLF